MVAAAKLRRAQELITGARPFADKVEELTSRILRELNQNESNKNIVLHPLLRKPIRNDESLAEQKPVAYMVAISSDKGLCGAYNTNVIKLAIKHVKTLEENFEVKFFVWEEKLQML